METTNTQAGKITRRTFVAGLAAAPIALSACSSSQGGSTPAADTKGDADAAAAEGLTMLTASVNYQNFSEALTEATGVELSMQSYAGYNTTDYIYTQMRAEDCPDIVINTFPNSAELQKANLVDLSSKEFINNVRMKLLDDISIDGAVYFVPSNMSFFGPYYNKTLFEKNGWSMPESLDELEELIPQIQAAGVTLSEVTSTLPGSAFAFLWDILAPNFSTTLEGMTWMKQFIAGEAKATGTLEPYVETFQRWIDLGMFNIDPNIAEDKEAINRFKEGNTAFLVTVSNQSFTQNEDGTGDEYRIMPWLSADGSNNIIVTNVSRYYGLNKRLEDDVEKLEQGYAAMEFLTTVEAQEALLVNTNMVSPLKNAAVEEDNPLHDVAAMVDEGKSMPMVYSGWENYVADMGKVILSCMKGEITTTDMLAQFDDIQASVVASGGLEVVAEATEDLELAQVAQLVGTAFAKAAEADCALISLGGFHGFGKENKSGINGKIYAGIPVDSNVVCTFNPLGWKQLIKTATLDGATIKQWVEEGFFADDDPEPFEYVLVAPEGTELEDSELYTVALVNESEDRAAEGNMAATELVGQDVLVEYLTDLGTVNAETIAWK